MFDYLKTDLMTYCKGDSSLAAKIQVLRRSYGFRATLIYRFGRWVESKLKHPAFLPLRGVLLAVHAALSLTVDKAFGIRIDRRASIGGGLHIYHFGGIVIGACRIGENCRVHQHVRIGDRKPGGTERIPQVGNNVWIGPHARICGAVRVGDNVTIAAGAVVTRNTGDNCLVGGNPARAVSVNYDNAALFRKRAEPDSPNASAEAVGTAPGEVARQHMRA